MFVNRQAVTAARWMLLGPLDMGYVARIQDRRSDRQLARRGSWRTTGGLVPGLNPGIRPYVTTTPGPPRLRVSA